VLLIRFSLPKASAELHEIGFFRFSGGFYPIMPKKSTASYFITGNPVFAENRLEKPDPGK
jgi:hypothetical protein